MALFTLAGFISCQGKSQTKYMTATNNKSLLWEVSGNGLQKPSYIFGTMHLLCASDAQLSDPLISIIQHVDEIYFEIDLDDLGELYNGATMGLMTGDTSLSDLLSPDDYSRVREFFEKHGMSMEFGFLQKMQPMLIGSLVYQAILPCEQTDGMEMAIMQVAHENKKEIKGLETAAFQVGILEQIPYSRQAADLMKSVDSVKEGAKQIEEMIALYKSQDIDSLLAYSLKNDGGDSPEIQDKMIYQRNQNWANKFPEVSKDKQILIAVGAGHLGGEKGLLQLLKNQGYTIRPLQNQKEVYVKDAL
ncbi:MAG: TraB/GumN family protein [Bacteroidetes bacterium]|nr:TraB/GumN family protein [Bacteroidota bacterium]